MPHGSIGQLETLASSVQTRLVSELADQQCANSVDRSFTDMAVTQDVRNKVVVRKLPPGISQEEVQAAIDTVCQGKYDWFTFVPGKVRYTVV